MGILPDIPAPGGEVQKALDRIQKKRRSLLNLRQLNHLTDEDPSKEIYIRRKLRQLRLEAEGYQQVERVLR